MTRNAESLMSNMDRVFQIARKTVCLATCIKANITPCGLTADDQAIAAHVMRADEQPSRYATAAETAGVHLPNTQPYFFPNNNPDSSQAHV